MQIPTLKLYINPELHTQNDFLKLYREHIDKHNANVTNDPYPDAGFDLIVPGEVEEHGMAWPEVFIPPGSKAKYINMGVKAEMVESVMTPGTDGHIEHTSSAFYLYPRSSISKTPLMLANHTGIIDSGYRGWLIGAFRNLSSEDYMLPMHTRLLQICHPRLCPFYVELVSDENALNLNTARGEGGFGSTGKTGTKK